MSHKHFHDPYPMTAHHRYAHRQFCFYTTQTSTWAFCQLLSLCVPSKLHGGRREYTDLTVLSQLVGHQAFGMKPQTEGTSCYLFRFPSRPLGGSIRMSTLVPSRCIHRGKSSEGTTCYIFGMNAVGQPFYLVTPTLAAAKTPGQISCVRVSKSIPKTSCRRRNSLLSKTLRYFQTQHGCSKT